MITDFLLIHKPLLSITAIMLIGEIDIIDWIIVTGTLGGGKTQCMENIPVFNTLSSMALGI